MESINNAYAVSAPNDPVTYRREQLYKDLAPGQRIPVVRPVAAATGRQDTVEFSGSNEDPPLYGATGKFLADDRGKGNNTPVGAEKPPDPQNDPRIQAVVARLKAIEERVKAHEAAHKSVGGTLTGPVSFTYTRGPDGKSYITGGEVPIKISTGKTPEETVARMDQVIRAALAPADPSPQDRAVASQASTVQQQARMEMAGVTQITDEDGAVPAQTFTETDAVSAYQKGEPLVPLSVGLSSDQVDRSIFSVSRSAYTDPAVTGSKDEAIPQKQNSEVDAGGIPPFKKTEPLRHSARITDSTAYPTAIYA